MAGDERTGQILVAGVGNHWLGDDGFGGAVARRLAQRELPEGMVVMDAGTGGLDLAYEVMRGYDALVILDVSRQGGEPGTLYVMEADEQSVGGTIEDGELINPHGMDPQTVLRFVRSIGAWPGLVIVIACEPTEVEELGLGLSTRVEDALQRAVELVIETVGELQADPACRLGGGGGRCTSFR
ncbi:MAG TPA: hydrogenase maturation protease [Solirubrobacteraceae bacterium]|jgi:hydrogenase maturation protease|nr:hydrogenase maturation protease [Solirubrobacteraceae bacterium]